MAILIKPPMIFDYIDQSDDGKSKLDMIIFFKLTFYSYRVFKMDWGQFKELLWLFFCARYFSLILMAEKRVHFDIWTKDIF